ncbi:MAG: amino acid adenylation domain-containing protein [Acidobacteriaceae bacterium]
MSSIVEFLGQLRSKNVSISVDGDALKCSAPQGILTAELRRELGERKPEILAFLRASQRDGQTGQPGLSQIERIDRSGPLPLSLAQQRLWFLNQLDPSSSTYNIGMPLRMRGSLNIPALERSLIEIVQRHEDLRTTFIQVNGEPQAIISDGREWTLKKIDARHLSDDGSGSALFECVAEQYQELFDITRGPLFRASLLTAGANDYILVLTMHHMITDGWSVGVLMNEFRELYGAYTNGRSPSLAQLPIQYVDFAAWQRKWLESGELEHQLPYWRKQLAGAPPLVGFPADHRRPRTEMFRGCRSKLVVPRQLVIALEQLSHAQGATLFMILLAAFKVLLARYSDQDDIVVGSPSANRSRAELHSLVGFFVNNLVLRTDLGGNPSFTELLGRIREVTRRAYEHQDVPFDTLVQALRPQRSLDHSPLFQVMFILQNFPLDDLRLSGLVTTPLELEVTTARFDLTVEVFPRDGELWAYFDYNSDLYEPETIARIQRHYLAILNAVCADPDQHIGQIALLSTEERKQLLIDWKQTPAAIPGTYFHQQFSAHARATPDRVAVMAGEASITYGELDRRANAIAAMLQSRGAGAGKLVAICIERSVDLVAAMLGVAKSGAAYVPLDPVYPKARIANILEDSKPVVLLTSTHLLPSLPGESTRIVCLDSMSEMGIAAEMLLSRECAAREDLAYVIFTSGSTGRPKGVEITHRSLVNFLEGMFKEPGFSAEDVLLAVTTVSFDIAGLELLLPLYIGATVCIAQHPENPEYLLSDLARYHPTVMQATPATWKLLIAAGWTGDERLKILCGGEALDADLARSLLVRSGSLWNMYGPTETTIWSAALRVEEAGTGPIPIGRPMQNTSFYVFDAFQQPVPQGVAGELCIGGEGVARGYLNLPDLTAERFITSSFLSGPAARLYRTGDLVRYRRDGTLDFLGRMDHQVKLRGFRIELGEVEGALRNCIGVSDVVTVLREDDGDKRLVAYLAIAEDGKPSAPDLRNHLRTMLPEYMIPTEFVMLQELPRLPNGKLNRAALPAPDHSAADNKQAFSAPATTLQEKVAAAFRNALHIERVGLDDNFFDMGAHSLQIVKVHGELKQSIDANIPLISFFQYPTIRALTAFIEQHSHAEPLSVGAIGK